MARSWATPAPFARRGNRAPSGAPVSVESPPDYRAAVCITIRVRFVHNPPSPMRFPTCASLCLALCASGASATTTAMTSDWTTPAERAHFRTTPSYVETRAYLERLADAAPQTIRLTRFGVSPEGRDLMLVVAAKNGEFTPEAARALIASESSLPR